METKRVLENHALKIVLNCIFCKNFSKHFLLVCKNPTRTTIENSQEESKKTPTHSTKNHKKHRHEKHKQNHPTAKRRRENSPLLSSTARHTKSSMEEEEEEGKNGLFVSIHLVRSVIVGWSVDKYGSVNGEERALL